MPDGFQVWENDVLVLTLNNIQIIKQKAGDEKGWINRAK